MRSTLVARRDRGCGSRHTHPAPTLTEHRSDHVPPSVSYRAPRNLVARYASSRSRHRTRVLWAAQDRDGTILSRQVAWVRWCIQIIMYANNVRRLEVISYNIHKGVDAGNARTTVRGMRTALHRLCPDLVLLQEVVGQHRAFERRFSDWPGATQLEFIAGDEWQHHLYGRSAVHREGDHGNAILSRYPVIAHDNIDISLNPLEQRAILHAVIHVPWLTHELHVCCTHLNLLHRQRRHQIRTLIARINAVVPQQCPLIIGGDFNDWRTWATGALRNSIGAREAHVQIHGRHARTYPGWHPILPLDRIYVRGLNISQARVLDSPAWRRLSDHLAVTARLERQPNYRN